MHLRRVYGHFVHGVLSFFVFFFDNVLTLLTGTFLSGGSFIGGISGGGSFRGGFSGNLGSGGGSL
jgi:hypothetical protein